MCQWFEPERRAFTQRDFGRFLIPVLRELGIGLVPICPLGRGFLAGGVKRAEEYPEGDTRRIDPRYQGQNYSANVKATRTLFDIATSKGVKPGQIALAWLLHKGADIVPIPAPSAEAIWRRTWPPRLSA
jgi:aryl-alcohol dehydrogenase-like predicted oxidoreductase